MRAWTRNHKLLGNFETFLKIFVKISLGKLNLLTIFGKVVAKNIAFGNIIIFLQQVFQFRRVERSLCSPWRRLCFLRKLDFIFNVGDYSKESENILKNIYITWYGFNWCIGEIFIEVKFSFCGTKEFKFDWRIRMRLQLQVRESCRSKRNERIWLFWESFRNFRSFGRKIV